MASYATPLTPSNVAVLIDFDNVVTGSVPEAEPLSTLFQRIVALVLDRWDDAESIDLMLYGGWLADGVLTRRASELQSAIGAAPLFPLTHPRQQALLRGQVSLVTRLADAPSIEWIHTLRERSGVPRVRFRDGTYPLACTHRSSACPLRQLKKFSNSQASECMADGCDVTNGKAFRAPEQKMVDVLIACDIIGRTIAGDRVMVLSSDLDIVPAIAMAAHSFAGDIALRKVDRYGSDLYDAELRALGIEVSCWDGA